MEKVYTSRSASDRGRLRNRTEQNSIPSAVSWTAVNEVRRLFRCWQKWITKDRQRTTAAWASCLRSTTSNNRSCASQLGSGNFLLGSSTLHDLHLWIFLYAWCFVKNVALRGHFVICIYSCLVWIDVPNVKHYLNAIKAKQSVLNARNPWSAVGNPPLLVVPRNRAAAPQASRL